MVLIELLDNESMDDRLEIGELVGDDDLIGDGGGEFMVFLFEVGRGMVNVFIFLL
jgi:hypothetical protein